MHVVDMEVAPGKEEQLVADYRNQFQPAITSQPGFRAVRLLRPDESSRWLLLIEFDTEQNRMAWVATPEHQQAWPALARSCSSAHGADFNEVGA